MRGERGDARALASGVAAIEHQDGNVLLDRRQNSGRMQHLGAKVSQLGGLLKADDLDAQGVGADAGIGGHDAVHVGPYLDGLGGERAAEQGAGEIGAAAAQGGGDAGLVRGDEAAHHRHLAQDGEREQRVLGALFNDCVLGSGLLKLRVGDDDLARVHVGGVDAPFAEGRGDHAAGEALAITDDQVGDARGKFENRRQAAQNLIQGVEFLVDESDQVGGAGGVFDELGGGVAMA